MQGCSPVPGQFLEQPPAPGERDAPGVLPGDGQHIEGHERGGQLRDQGRQGGLGGDHALLQRLEVQPSPVPDDAFAIQNNPWWYMVCEGFAQIRQDTRKFLALPGPQRHLISLNEGGRPVAIPFRFCP